MRLVKPLGRLLALRNTLATVYLLVRKSLTVSTSCRNLQDLLNGADLSR